MYIMHAKGERRGIPCVFVWSARGSHGNFPTSGEFGSLFSGESCGRREKARRWVGKDIHVGLTQILRDEDNVVPQFGL